MWKAPPGAGSPGLAAFEGIAQDSRRITFCVKVGLAITKKQMRAEACEKNTRSSLTVLSASVCKYSWARRAGLAAQGR